MAERRTIYAQVSIEPESLDRFNEAVHEARKAMATMEEKLRDAQIAMNQLEFSVDYETKPEET